MSENDTIEIVYYHIIQKIFTSYSIFKNFDFNFVLNQEVSESSFSLFYTNLF